jgi:hypothetical protein
MMPYGIEGEDMLVEMKVKNLAFDLSKSGAMVFLEEINGKRIFVKLALLVP